jgi:hypothetical protein
MDPLHEDPGMNERLNLMRDQYGWIDERYDPEQGFYILREVGKYYLGVLPFAYTAAVIVGTIGDRFGYLDRWCYHTVRIAIAAGDAWDGNWPHTEPEGWHRHPGTGRRRENGDPSTEEVRM